MISRLRKRPWLMFLALVLAANPRTAAQIMPAATKGEPMAADDRIAAALRQVSAEHIRTNIEKLVNFGTRLTLSAQDPDSVAAGRGVGAAREWIKSEFERYSRDCGGCLEVENDSFTEPAADRIPQPTKISTVYACLTGPNSQK